MSSNQDSINAAKVILDALLELTFITEIQYDHVLETVISSDREVGEILVSEGIASQPQVIEGTAAALGVGFVNIIEIDIEKEAGLSISAEYARTASIIPLRKDGNSLEVAVTIENAQNLSLKDDLRRLTGASYIKFLVATKADITRAIKDFYRADDEIQKIGSTVTQKEGKDDSGDTIITNIDEVVEQSPVSKFVELIIHQAIADGASDIHFETHEKFLRVRYRIDAVLKPVTEAPIHMSKEIISRVKILSNLDISIKNMPQDGAMNIRGRDTKTNKEFSTDLRVSTLPGIWGENIVLRILDNSQAALNLEDLGFSPYNIERYEKAYTRPSGMSIVVGPTGSGKSTTLSATLNTLNSPDIKILTMEDPVEYKLEDIQQQQVNRAVGFDFGMALRAFLRHDPDVILIGEIRDHETAESALRAGMTGHSVFSTLHTQTAAEALPRLTDMGVEPHLINSTLNSVISQRLLRRLCKSCKIAYTPTEDELLAVGYPYNPEKDELPELFHSNPKGCKECAKTGYRGRLGVHEVLLMTDEIKLAVSKGATTMEVERLAKESGMVTMVGDAWYKVSHGITDIQEVLRTLI